MPYLQSECLYRRTAKEEGDSTSVKWLFSISPCLIGTGQHGADFVVQDVKVLAGGSLRTSTRPRSEHGLP